MNALFSQIKPLADLPLRRTRAGRRHAGASRNEPEELRFPKGALRALPLGTNETVKLRVLQGSWWMTMEGDHHDYAAEAGCELRFIGPGVLVVEALAPENALIVESAS